jgi:membrane protein DedA with SNARE-associated domain
MSREEAEGAMNWFHRYGPVAVFFGRLVPTVRTLISVPAGALRESFPSFLAFHRRRQRLWIAILAGAGYLLEENYEAVEHWVNPHLDRRRGSDRGALPLQGRAGPDEAPRGLRPRTP